MHARLTAVFEQRERMLRCVTALQSCASDPLTPQADDLADLRRRLTAAILRLLRLKSDWIIPAALASGPDVKAWALDTHARDIALYRRFDALEEQWPVDEALKDWLGFRNAVFALVADCERQFSRSETHLYPLLMSLNFDASALPEVGEDLDWDSERWKILRRYPRGSSERHSRQQA